MPAIYFSFFLFVDREGFFFDVIFFLEQIFFLIPIFHWMVCVVVVCIVMMMMEMTAKWVKLPSLINGFRSSRDTAS